MHYVYILLLKNNQLYTGSTYDIRQRIKDHKNGKVKSTAKRLPVKFLHVELYLLKTDAQRREKYLKTTEGKYFLRQQIRDLLVKYNIA